MTNDLNSARVAIVTACPAAFSPRPSAMYGCTSPRVPNVKIQNFMVDFGPTLVLRSSGSSWKRMLYRTACRNAPLRRSLPECTISGQANSLYYMAMSNEADTCRNYVVPKLRAAGWDNDPHSIAEQHTFTDGRILVSGNATRRRPGRRSDYLLRYTR